MDFPLLVVALAFFVCAILTIPKLEHWLLSKGFKGSTRYSVRALALTIGTLIVVVILRFAFGIPLFESMPIWDFLCS